MRTNRTVVFGLVGIGAAIAGLSFTLVWRGAPLGETAKETSTEESGTQPSGVVLETSTGSLELNSSKRASSRVTVRRKAVEAKVVQSVRAAIGGVQTVMEGTGQRQFVGELYDSTIPLGLKRQFAWKLARSADSRTLQALAEVLGREDTPSYLRAAIAEALAHNPHPGARVLIEATLTDEDEIVVRGAIRGLAALGDLEATRLLAGILGSEEQRESVRIEAATGLGNVDLPDAYGALVEAYGSFSAEDRELAASVLEGLGSRRITETRIFFEEVLNAGSTPTDLRVAAIEGLESAAGDVGSVLIEYTEDSDPEVREAAAWALASVPEPGDHVDELQDLLGKEDRAEVRKRLYQALGNQGDVGLLEVSNAVFGESDPAARLAGYDLLASKVIEFDEETRQQFVDTAIPELQATALTARNPGERLGAVVVLKKTKLPESVAALEAIAMETSDSRIAKATGQRTAAPF